MAASQIFHTEGRRLLNQILNSVVAPHATWYVGLRQLDGVGGHPADAAAADTLSSNLQEVSGSGYSRQSVLNDTTHSPEAASGANSVITLDQVTFTFSGTVTGITHAFIATTSNNTGKLFASAPLSVTRNVANGDQIKVTYSFTLTQG